MEHEVTLSVVLPVYNGQDYIEEAIESILNQTFIDFELIIINDGSTDNSLEIIKKFDDSRIILVDQENKGLSKTLNIGLNLARGRYVARMDADDIALPNRFEKQIKYLLKHQNTVLLGSAIELIDKDGKTIYIDVPYTGSSFLKNYLKNIGNPFKHPTVLFDRKLALKVGGYNELIGKYIEDYFLWNEMAQYGDIDILDEVLLKYRITPGSIMSSIKTKRFAEFTQGVINRRQFTEQDLIEMEMIKSEEKKDGGESKEILYSKRIFAAKKNKINRVLNGLTICVGPSMAIKITARLKKALLRWKSTNL